MREEEGKFSLSKVELTLMTIINWIPFQLSRLQLRSKPKPEFKHKTDQQRGIVAIVQIQAKFYGAVREMFSCATI